MHTKKPHTSDEFTYSEAINLLCVEDSPTDAELILRALKGEGLEIVERVTDNREGFIRELEQDRPDVILSDFHMPGFDGFQALELSKNKYPDVPFIVVSGEVSVPEQHKLLRYKADDLILKGNLTRLPFAVMHALYKARDRKKLQQALNELTEANREKEILLSEIHHRVKNNLAVISSFLELQKMYTENDQFEGLVGNILLRIKSIALVHEKLYQSENLSQISLDEFIEDLISYIRSISGKGKDITYNLDIEKLDLNVNQAVPSGLIISELVNNAIEHAFPEREGGEITIRIKERDGEIQVEIRDNGIGIPDHLDFGRHSSHGMVIIDALAKQLNAELAMDNEEGTAIRFSFEREAGKKGSSSNLMSFG